MGGWRGGIDTFRYTPQELLIISMLSARLLARVSIALDTAVYGFILLDSSVMYCGGEGTLGVKAI